MAYSTVSYLGTGSQVDFAIPFPYLSQSHVEASINGVPTAITFPNASTARFASAPAGGAVVILRRNSSRAARLVDFESSATITESDLDTDSLQAFYLAQEAIDQGVTASAFTNDANGTRVTNMADPVNDTDGVNKQYLVAYTTALGLGGGGGLDLRPLNNTWTGTNSFDNTVAIKGATFDGTDVAAKDLLKLNKGLYVRHMASTAADISYGYAAWVQKSSGYAFTVGTQSNAVNLCAGSSGWSFGIATEAWMGRDTGGTMVGTESAIVNLNPSNLGNKVGIDAVFKNREEGASEGGNAATLLGTAGYGTGANYYNVNSWAYSVSAVPRSDSGATYVGWSRGMVFRDGWCDLSRTVPYNAVLQYTVGDIVLNGGVAYQCVATPPIGTAPPNASYWTPLSGGDARKAIGIDFSTVSATTASRMLAAIKLRANMVFMWDTEEHIGTHFDALSSGRWKLMNDTYERFGVDVATGNVWVNASPRLLANQSLVDAHRNSAAQFLSAGWQTVTCASEVADNRGEHNTSTGRFTPNTPGVYLVVGQVTSEGASTAGGERLLAGIGKNGSIVKAGSTVTVTGKDVSASVTALVTLNGTTDYVDLWAYWSGGGTGYLTGVPSVTFLQATKVS